MADELKASWGVRSSVDGIKEGIVVGLEMHVDGSFISETDVDGKQVASILYDFLLSAEIDVMIPATEAGPKPGEQIKIRNATLYVKETRVMEANQSYMKLHVSAAGSHSVTEAIDALNKTSGQGE